jgi:hypothetical protein
MRIRGRFERASQLCYAASGIMAAEPGLLNDRTGLSEIKVVYAPARKIASWLDA